MKPTIFLILISATCLISLSASANSTAPEPMTTAATGPSSEAERIEVERLLQVETLANFHQKYQRQPGNSRHFSNFMLNYSRRRYHTYTRLTRVGAIISGIGGLMIGSAITWAVVANRNIDENEPQEFQGLLPGMMFLCGVAILVPGVVLMIINISKKRKYRRWMNILSQKQN